MKTLLCLLSGLCVLVTSGCVGVAQASNEAPVPVVVTPPPAAEPGSLDELVAPIALYPDALVALILPAATVSSDIVLAARWLGADVDHTQIDAQPWDTSVKGLARYPDVVKWMDENLGWTQQLGEAYLEQPQEVMAAIQRDRARARAAGILVDTEQQLVVVEDGAIRIVPAQSSVIYVPRYDPEIVYVDRPVYFGPDPWITFGIGFGVGSWLAYDCDWHSRRIWFDHHRHAHWRHHHDWRHPRFPGRPGYVHRPGWEHWKPKPGRVTPPHRRHFGPGHRHHPRPNPIAGAPRFDRDHHRPRVDRTDRPDTLRPTPGRSEEHRPGRERFGRIGPRPDRTPGPRPQPGPAATQANGAQGNPAPARQFGPWRPGREHGPAVQRERRNPGPNAAQRENRDGGGPRHFRGPDRRPDIVRTPPAAGSPAVPNVNRGGPGGPATVRGESPRQHFRRSEPRPIPSMQAPRAPAAQPVARVPAPPPQMRHGPPPAMRSAAPAPRAMEHRPAPAARVTEHRAAPAPRMSESRPAPAPRMSEPRSAPAPRMERAESSGGGGRDHGGGSRGGGGGGGRHSRDVER